MSDSIAAGESPPYLGIVTGLPRLHVAIGPSCNNNCVFCMEEDRERRREAANALDGAAVRRILEANRGGAEVCFTSGEPTLVEALPNYIAWARELGYARRSVATNGRRLAYAAYTQRLVRAGVNLFNISIHGHTAALHDGVARSPGAFAQSVAGITEVARSGGAGVQLHTATVINRRNLGEIAAIHAFVRALGAQQVVFNMMQAHGRGATYFDQLFPRYRDVVAAFAALVQAVPAGTPVYLVDCPACVTASIAAGHKGALERYVHHEVTTGPNGGGLAAHARADFDRAQRRKRAECRTCVHDPDCDGIWARYIETFGWEEFAPLVGDGRRP